jgi:hypothetical protein
MVSPKFAEKLIRELADTGNVIDPKLLKLDWKKAKGDGATMEEEIFLLSLPSCYLSPCGAGCSCVVACMYGSPLRSR